jgi:hypothetical protein
MRGRVTLLFQNAAAACSAVGGLPVNLDLVEIYQPELVRVWPKAGKDREKSIMEFAQRHHWRLRFYKDGLCAIFDKEPDYSDST